MPGCIKAIRAVCSSLLVLLLSLTVVIGIPFAALAHTVTNRENIKSLIHNINLYDDAVDIATGFIPTTEKEGPLENSILTELADSESAVRSSIESIVTPELLENSVNTIVDAVYDWASGKTTRPEFTVTVTNDTDTLIDLLSVGFTQKLEGLPACPSDFEVPSNFDPLGTECLPEGFDTSEVNTFLRKNADAP